MLIFLISKIHIFRHPGRASDDQALYGSGHPETETTSHTGHPTGEGTHLAAVRGDNISNPINVTGDQTSNTSATTGNIDVLGSNAPAGQHYDRDAATLGTASAVANPSPLRRENKQDVTPTSGRSGVTQDTRHLEENERSGLASSNPSSGQHHLGRDAAALGTAGVVGEGIHHHRQNEQGLGQNTGLSGTTQGVSQNSELVATQGVSNPHIEFKIEVSHTSKIPEQPIGRLEF
jgi:hypothetical protein